MLKVTFLAVMPSPYVQDLFARMAADDRFDIEVLYLEQVAPDTYWGPQRMPEYARVLPGRWVGFLGARVHVNPSIVRALRASSADITVIVGYSGVTNQIAMRWLTRHGRRWAFWGEVPGLQSRGRVGRWLRQTAQRPLESACGVAAVGSHAVAAYRELLPESGDRVFRNIPYHCNTQAFQQAAQQRVPAEVVRFLYCGQLIRRKGVDLLVEAFGRLVASGVEASLTLVGEGPLRDELQAGLSAETALRVNFAGFHPVDQLPELFGRHDVFLLPSRHDGWGVVVNQAIAAGMPVIATSEVGAANDLVEDGRNGFRVAPDSSDAIYSAMQHFTDAPDTVRTFGARSAALAEGISMSRAMDDWHEFLTAASGSNRVAATPPSAEVVQ